MDNSIKISLTIILEGSALVRKSEPEKIKYVVTERDLNPSKKWKGKDGLKVIRKGETKHYPLIPTPATKHINMTRDAYCTMISECPYWCKPKVWRAMNQKERLEAHLQRTCEHFNGKSYIYEILND